LRLLHSFRHALNIASPAGRKAEAGRFVFQAIRLPGDSSWQNFPSGEGIKLPLECWSFRHLARNEDQIVRTHFAKRPLRRRLIALATAYLIALSSLIASFGAAAEVPGNTGAIICHADGGGLSSPTRDQTNDKTRADCCNAGCLMLISALPSPPASAVALTLSTGAIAHYRAAVVIVAAFHVNSHRSRAPPLRA
jgi:hypothetical protein